MIAQRCELIWARLTHLNEASTVKILIICKRAVVTHPCMLEGKRAGHIMNIQTISCKYHLIWDLEIFFSDLIPTSSDLWDLLLEVHSLAISSCYPSFLRKSFYTIVLYGSSFGNCWQLWAKFNRAIEISKINFPKSSVKIGAGVEKRESQWVPLPPLRQTQLYHHCAETPVELSDGQSVHASWPNSICGAPQQPRHVLPLAQAYSLPWHRPQPSCITLLPSVSPMFLRLPALSYQDASYIASLLQLTP